MSNEVTKVKRETIAECMTCPLCNNLYKQATTISQCLHTFCRKCIYDKITDEDLECCPVCNIDLGCVPLEKLRLDHNKLKLRDIVFPSKRREVKEPEVVAASVPLPAKRKEKCLSSLVVNTPGVSAQSTMTGRRTKPTRKASSLRSSSFSIEKSIEQEEELLDNRPESSSSPETSNNLCQNNEQPQSSQPEIDLAKLTRVLNVPEQEKANTSVDDQNQQVNISKISILPSSETLLELHSDTNLVNETSVDNQQVQTQLEIIPDITQSSTEPEISDLEAEAREIKARSSNALDCYLEHIKEDVIRKSTEDFAALIQSIERANLPRLTFPTPTIIEEAETMDTAEDHQMVMASDQEEDKEISAKEVVMNKDVSTEELDAQPVCMTKSTEDQDLIRRMDAQDERLNKMSDKIDNFEASQKQIMEMFAKLIHRSDSKS